MSDITDKNDIKRERAWYAIHTYAGYENAVERNLRQRIESLGVEDLIFDVLVPTEKKVKIKNGKRVEVEERIYPGYVLVDMIVTEDSWFIVRNTPRVTGFIGAGGTDPVPVKQEEIDAIFARAKNTNIEQDSKYEIDETVMITDGPFSDFEGKISGIDTERGKVKLLVSMFGRETPVELDFLQIKKL
ncbi:transcription termination/antitermination protein NusG [Candidatus Campbellbacteria bacterium]|nr:transcription termination/antitermination protein NusG [Candidatus Campbellbacteria bacterium]|tara:strand:- start:224 stop:784 length:561 start_codon:yes stop_codon:yes gene_type:complete